MPPKDIVIREKVLKSIRDALIERMDCPYASVDRESPIYKVNAEGQDVAFAENFIREGGKFVFCDDIQEAIDSIRFFAHQEAWDKIYCAEPSLQRLLNYAGIPYADTADEMIVHKIGMSTCMALIAQSGAVVYDSKMPSGRRMISSVDTHVLVATTDQICADLNQALDLMAEKYAEAIPSAITVRSGYSRVQDIDGAVQSALGPRQTYLFLIDIKTND